MLVRPEFQSDDGAEVAVAKARCSDQNCALELR